ncbi:hypothetical protein E1283_18730 [Streptomyces hainanensis]|uniref:Uncharacterized protein n=1 Tax=Streptomyces hainanensis TaxID=402648 RepID=A0A4R4T935_9ACTN|nr:hypothetical protein E1283_18730 [Streptomyces hainanensis]
MGPVRGAAVARPTPGSRPVPSTGRDLVVPPGSREPGAGSREPGAGSREPGAGSRHPASGPAKGISLPSWSARCLDKPIPVTLGPEPRADIPECRELGGCTRVAWLRPGPRRRARPGRAGDLGVAGSRRR